MKNAAGVEKTIIGMSHFGPLAGDPHCEGRFSMEKTAQIMLRDVFALQNGGVDAVMFSNEGSRPWMLHNKNHTLCTMAAVLGSVIRELSVPFGVHVIWDAQSTLCLAAATGADFAWEVFGGAYASDYGLWSTQSQAYAELMREWGVAKRVRRLCEVLPEAAVTMDARPLADRISSMSASWPPYAFCIAGMKPGIPPPIELLNGLSGSKAKIFVSTGVRKENAAAYFAAADGAIIGSAFKRDGMLFNEVDEARVHSLIAAIM